MNEAIQKIKHSLPSVALITAGASGIGCAIAQRFLQNGYKVHVCDIDQVAMDRFLEENPAATATLADVANPGQVDSLFAELEEHYGRLDILVNNAGIAGPTARVEDIDPVDWDRTIAVGLNGAFYVTRRAIPLLKQAGGGSVINMASSAAFFGCPLRSPYVAAKWAMIGFTKTLAMELGPLGIRVNAICPGSVSGPRIEGVIERDAKQRGITTQEVRDSWTRQTSLRSFVSADAVAATVAFLVSPDGAMISGQALGVDGHTESLSSPLD